MEVMYEIVNGSYGAGIQRAVGGLDRISTKQPITLTFPRIQNLFDNKCGYICLILSSFYIVLNFTNIIPATNS